jgi:replicative DNA helicase
MNQDPAAERAVLSSYFQHGKDSYIESCDIIDEECFNLDSNKIVFKCLKHYYQEENEKIDIPTFLSTANSLGYKEFFESKDEKKYLNSLTILPVEFKNIRKLAGKLVKLKIASLLSKEMDFASLELNNVTGDESLSNILSIAEQRVFEFTLNLAGAEESSPKSIGDGLDEYVDHLESNPVTQIGISSGFPIFDQCIGGGLRPGTVNVIGARMKTGKSFFGDAVALHVSGETNIPVLVLDTEMSNKDHWHRMLACLSGVKINDIETGKYTTSSESKKRIYQAKEKLKSIPYFYKSIAGQAFEETSSIIRRWIMQKVGVNENGQANQCLIVFDYIKLMSDNSISKNVAEYQALGFLMTSLHNLCVKYQIPCLAFIQLNRDGINREDTDVASGSDRILWLCSNFSIYKRKSEEELAEEEVLANGKRYNLKLIPIVSRHGNGLSQGDYINMLGEYEVGRIKEGPTRNNFHSLRNTNSGFSISEEVLKDEPIDFFGSGEN